MFIKLSLLALLISQSALAKDVVLHTKTVTLPVSIGAERMRFSIADYSSPVVKVLVPELAAETLMNHRNTSEGAPCLATYRASTPSEIIQGNEAIEQVNFKIELIKHLLPDPENQICFVSLSEVVTATIRGFEFVHTEYSDLPQRHIDDCE